MMQNKLHQLFLGGFDRFTQYFTNIHIDHRYIHDGKGFVGIVQTGSISAAYHIAFTTPADKYVHWRPALISTSASYIEYVLREGDSFSGGTPITPVNMNRNSAHVSTITDMVKGATATPTGTIIQAGAVGTAGIPSAQAGGGESADHERVLKRGETYILTLTPSAATSGTLELFWYEEGQG